MRTDRNASTTTTSTRAPSGMRFMLLVALPLMGLYVIVVQMHILGAVSFDSSAADDIINIPQVETSASSQPKAPPPSITETVTKCTSEQLDIIQKQLPPDECIKSKGQPWTQKCSFTYATKCPEAIWLDNHYKMKHNINRQTSNDQHEPFVGIFIGCNKGMDAVAAMRMGSSNPIFDKSVWKDAITKNGTIQLSHSVCNQDKTAQFEIQQEYDGSNANAMLHCVEAMPGTAAALKEAAHALTWDEKGFIVTHAAMSKSDGSVLFPSASGVGVENQGIGNCVKNPAACVNVTMHSLDTFVQKYVPGDATINYLSVDVEGFDMDVLVGGLNHALPRIEYLEFEYNWMGSWAKQHLRDLVDLLDDRGLTCYWPGYDGYIWRITGCWLDFYDIHMWSNVACVNRNMVNVKSMAEEMEDLFQKTLLKGEDVIMNSRMSPK
ncbi:hypothetical protein ACHAWO_012067 [Cyclotella atomus]|uniref:Methyltransferase FkbM domain-containing protein n=1 Tax=Cyclotella atomus TaxID=382360 RepID=A0ABD3NID0_9STRA